MKSADLPATLLARMAVVYVRQSSSVQVIHNLESQRRQYALADSARHHGFRKIEVIDDDLGLTASGMADRPGFDRLVTMLYDHKVGAVLCLDATRLARNGRDWEHLLEVCGFVGARIIDLNQVYDPNLPNDRLLLGLQGALSAFELSQLRHRMLEAARAKARRGALRIPVPPGFAVKDFLDSDERRFGDDARRCRRETVLAAVRDAVDFRAAPVYGPVSAAPAKRRRFRRSRSRHFGQGRARSGRSAGGCGSIAVHFA